MPATFSSSPNPPKFGLEEDKGAPLIQFMECPERGPSAEGQEMRAPSPPSSRHLVNKDLALLTAQKANEIPWMQ